MSKDGKEDVEKSEVEDLVRHIIGKKGEPNIRIRKDLTDPSPVIDHFEIFQKRFREDGNSGGTDPGPSTSTAKTHDKDMGIMESALRHEENTQLSSSSNEKSLAAEEGKSPFVSDTLDEFLTGNAHLNISYNIPKSSAEQGISELHFENEPAQLVLKKVVDLKREHDDEEIVKKAGKKVNTGLGFVPDTTNKTQKFYFPIQGVAC
nr:unnamed protein product [Callosobruchus chinensis]